MGRKIAVMSARTRWPDVVISYTREDKAAAHNLKRGFATVEIDAWLDSDGLLSGDRWQAKIRQLISNCVLFIPLISKHTEARASGFFRKEWVWAEQRSFEIAQGVPFIVPVVIDTTQIECAWIPDVFAECQSCKLPGGVPTGKFLGTIRKLVRESPLREH
jgi:hypothetical protein